MAKQTKCFYQHHAIATGGPCFAELKQRRLIDERVRGADQDPDFYRLIPRRSAAKRLAYLARRPSSYRHSSLKMFGRRFADLLLFCVTCAELVILFLLTPTFTITDWIYVLQHFIVLGIALTRPHPKVRDYSIASSLAVGVAYVYPYAQVIDLRWSPGYVAWPAGGLALVMLTAGLSLVSLLAMGRRFGVRPALRDLVTGGPYRFVRHPMYLSYILGDIGYNLQEWNFGTILLVLVGWASLVYRIHAEEQVLSQHARWPAYVALVRYRLFPGLW